MKTFKILSVLGICSGLLVSCAKMQHAKVAEAPLVTTTAEVETFRVECGAPTQEEQARAGTQAVSLVVYGKVDLTNVDTTVSEAERTDIEARTAERKWSVYFDTNHDGDAVELSVIRNGASIDGYRIVDKVKENGHYGKDGKRVVEIKGLADCLTKQGGKELEATARYYGERPETNKDGVVNVVREEKKTLTGCTCSFEMK